MSTYFLMTLCCYFTTDTVPKIAESLTSQNNLKVKVSLGLVHSYI